MTLGPHFSGALAVCGICGIVDLRASSVSEADLLALRDGIRHRGPDDAGTHIEGGVGLGARRLSILDLSPRGHMPMANDDETLWLTYNGEVYNFAELRRELEARGRRFRSDSDTEVVLRAYEEWGEACVERLAGMFAFALWDRPRRRLFAARDRLGVKPLFFAHEGSRLVFASEIHGLYRFVPPTPDRIDPLALDYVLRSGYPPPDRCFVRGLQKLPPAHTLVFDEHGLRLQRYWRVRFRPQRRLDLEEALDELDERLGRAVARRLRSDVPLGAFLSGGIDSGLVTALAARAVPGPLNTFSVGFTGARPDEDERPLARLVSERYGTQHRELTVATDHRRILTRVLWHVGEPFADVGALPMYEISREAKQFITVALSGDGGDESFAGYGNIRAAALAQRFRQRAPAPVRRLLAGLAGAPGVQDRVAAAGKLARWLERYVERNVAEQLREATSWSDPQRASLYGPEARRRLGDTSARQIVEGVLAAAGPLEDGELHLFADLELLLPGDYLTKVDIASSMASLEVRSPFLDHELVEFAASLPLSQKLLGGRQKGLLRRLAERHLPEAVVQAPKRGFAPSLSRWLRGDWADLVRSLTDDSRWVAAGTFDADVVRRTVAEHLDGRADHGYALWVLLCLEIWWRLFVDRSLAPGDAL